MTTVLRKLIKFRPIIKVSNLLSIKLVAHLTQKDYPMYAQLFLLEGSHRETLEQTLFDRSSVLFINHKITF